MIKKLTLADIELLQAIGKTTFVETFEEHNTKENMAAYLEEKFSLPQLHAELSHPHSEFYFAMQNNQVQGYLKLNVGDAQTELKNNHSIEIERIYVLKAFHGGGAGKELFAKALQIASEQNKTNLWLGVWEKNTRAIHFYKKNGLVEFDKHIFKLGEDEQTDILMQLTLPPSLQKENV